MLINYLKVDFKAGLFLLLMVVVLPTIIVLCAQYFSRKKKNYRVTLFVVALSFLLGIGFYFNIERSRVVVTDVDIQLQNSFYTRTISINKITSVELYDELPAELRPRWKSNGLSIGGIRIGNFLLEGRKSVFFMLAQSPFNVVTVGGDKFIFSTTKEINERIAIKEMAK